MSAETLFDRFLAARERGDEPDVAALLDEAGAERETLGLLIDRYLTVAPVRPPSHEQLLEMRARLNGTTVLTEARVERSLTVETVVDSLAKGFAIPDALRGKLRRRYQELEGGQLDPTRIQVGLAEAIGNLIGADPLRPAASSVFTAGTSAIFHRLTESAAPAPAMALPPADDVSPTEPDDVDRLFGIG